MYTNELQLNFDEADVSGGKEIRFFVRVAYNDGNNEPISQLTQQIEIVVHANIDNSECAA
jgi:hypothetical protein